MEPIKTEKSREKARGFLKAHGKDPEKLMPKDAPNPEAKPAGSGSSLENKKGVDDQLTEQERKEQESRAAEAKKAEEAKALEAKKAEDKRLLEAKEEDLSDEEKTKKKELLVLRETEKEAQKEAKLQKRFDDLTGQIKALKADKDQDQGKIAELENELKQLKGAVQNDPKKIQEEAKRLETDRLRKYEDEDKSLPLAERREMSKTELEEWLVEDMVSAQEWLAERQIRRREERNKDIEKLNKPKDDDSRVKAEAIIKKQAESRDRVTRKHPELDVMKRMRELKAEGKSREEIQAVIFKENPKARIVSQIVKEDPDKYMLAENGPELLAEEMEKRLAKEQGENKITETEEEKETRIAQEAAEAERQRQANIDAGLRSTRNGDGSNTTEQEKDPVYQKQLEIWRRAFPNETDAQVKARLDKRLKERRLVGAM